ncbi:DUF4383 domain-containing protein [Salinispora tropica]|uniref:DUF4383 domain-containing protein n=1 Tax=Salinispora tropica (strain ATCC BAA-916 / DSM 44818 / JCM 13857 / NBRC 105044 / CNB-440) TaxID=369723 RepID=A4XAG0_SALTO|nr:DUF4383 domain-containing protein [Salinispora tropica]ABP55909.1 hypothetical protein Strop_3478 [Salinispora tropica CNB-440]
MAEHAQVRTRTGLQTAALTVAVIFLLLGVLGFVPGITTDYGELRFAGPDSGAKLFGLFQVSFLHNILLLGSGLAGLMLARRVGGARVFLTVGGALTLGLWLYGFAIDRESSANVIPVNEADNWLHLGVGFAMLVLGLLLSNQKGTGGQLDTPLDRP